MGTNCRTPTKKKYTDSQLIFKKKTHLQSNPIQICVVIHLYSLQTNKQSKDGICRSHSIFRNGNYRDYVRNENPRNDNNHIGGTSRGRTTTTTTRSSARSDT